MQGLGIRQKARRTQNHFPIRAHPQTQGGKIVLFQHQNQGRQVLLRGQRHPADAPGSLPRIADGFRPFFSGAGTNSPASARGSSPDSGREGSSAEKRG